MDLTRFHDLVCAQAVALAALGDTDSLEVRKAKALGVIADHQAALDLLTLTNTGTSDGTGSSNPRRLPMPNGWRGIMRTRILRLALLGVLSAVLGTGADGPGDRRPGRRRSTEPLCWIRGRVH